MFGDSIWLDVTSSWQYVMLSLSDFSLIFISFLTVIFLVLIIVGVRIVLPDVRARRRILANKVKDKSSVDENNNMV